MVVVILVEEDVPFAINKFVVWDVVDVTRRDRLLAVIVFMQDINASNCEELG